MFSIITFINYIAQAFSTDEVVKDEVTKNEGQGEVTAVVEKKEEERKEEEKPKEEIQKEAPNPVVPPVSPPENPPKAVTTEPEGEEEQ